MKCKICNKDIGNTFIEEVSQICLDCLKLFTEDEEESEE